MLLLIVVYVQYQLLFPAISSLVDQIVQNKVCINKEHMQWNKTEGKLCSMLVVLYIEFSASVAILGAVLNLHLFRSHNSQSSDMLC